MQKLVSRCENDPEWFYENVLGFAPLKWQIRASEAVMDVRRKIAGASTKENHEGLPRITIRSCHGTGKTQFLGMLMHLWNFTTFGKIACTAPKQDQLTRRLLPRYRRAMRDAHPQYQAMCRTLGTEVIFCGNRDWGAALETASDPTNLAGYHDMPQLFIVDEASSKKLDPMYQVIEGALSTPGSVLVEIGNPTRIDGEFYQHHCGKRVKDLYYKMHIKPEDAPDIVSDEWLKTMEIKYGKDSPIYLIRCLGEFASFDEAILFPFDYIEDAMDRDFTEDGSHPKIRVTVDVADGGADSTVITVSKIYDSMTVILKQKAFNFQPSLAPLESAKAAIAMFESFGGIKNRLDDFVVDANGVGSGTAGFLMEAGYNVIRYVGGSSSSDPDRWRNIRVQCHMALYEAFRDGKITIIESEIDDVEELKQHLLSIKRASPDKKTDDIVIKEKVKAEYGFSPDRSDSLCMQFIDYTPERLDLDFICYATQSQASLYDAAL